MKYVCAFFLLALLGLATMPTMDAAETDAVETGEPGVDFPGFDPEERLLEQAMMHVSGIADQLNLANRGEIDTDTALERIESARSALTEVLKDWRAAEHPQRVEARQRRMADIRQFERYLADGLEEYGSGPNVDFHLVQLIREPPRLAEFLREPPIETFTGVYRSGFEASVFYLLEGGGDPWWVETNDGNWDTLQSYLVQRPGRGSSVTVALTVAGWLETQGEFGHLGSYDTLLYIDSIDAIRPISPEAFELAVGLN